MDASISTSTEMTNIEHILGTGAVPVSELSVEERLAIVNACIERCKGFLKSFPGFSAIPEWVNQFQGNYDSRKTAPEVIEYGEGISDTMHLLNIEGLLHDCTGRIEPGLGVRFVHRKDLMLNRDGKFVLWEAKYQRIAEHGLGYRHHRSGVTEQAQFAKFHIVGEDALLELLEANPGLVRTIISRLWARSHEKVEQAVITLDGTRLIENYFSGIMQRLAA